MSIKWLSQKCPKCGAILERPVGKCPECNFTDEENKIAKILFGIGVGIIILGILGSLILGNIYPSVETTYDYYSSYLYSSPQYDSEVGYNWMVFLIGSLSSAISGILMIGFSELISLNQQTLNLLKK